MWNDHRHHQQQKTETITTTQNPKQLVLEVDRPSMLPAKLFGPVGNKPNH